MQLILIFEANSISKTEYKYVKKVLDKYYAYREDCVSIKDIYANGKTNLIQQDKKICDFKKRYSGDKSEVIIFADYDSQGDSFNDTIKKYCSDKRYHLVWFNPDVEGVFLGKKVENRKKNETSEWFLRNWESILEDLTNLDIDHVESREKSSNILKILDKLLRRK